MTWPWHRHMSLVRGGGQLGLLLVGLGLLAGCDASRSEPEVVWGKHGLRDGDFNRPRAAAIDRDDHLYIVDFSARLQVFDRDGAFVGPCVTSPDYRNGRPSGLSIDRDGNLLVSDSHYHCLRVYSPRLELLRTIGGIAGSAPGQLGYVSDAVQDLDGTYYIAEFGENQRISKFDRDGRFIACWGSPGMEPGQFAHIRALALGPDHNLYVVEVDNHRIQVFTKQGELVRWWGGPGTAPGEMSYPFDLAFNKAGVLYVVERGNNRVQKFTMTGESLGCWGGPGRDPGKLRGPWALAVDSKGSVHVLDSDNHRIQRIRF